MTTCVYVIAFLSTTLLFLFRANSVYHDARFAKIAFSLLWSTTAVSALCVPFSFTAARATPQRQCVIIFVSKLIVIPSAVLVIFDTTVYISISYRMTTFWVPCSKWTRCKAFFTGTGSGPISSALLHTGQLYFLCVLFPFIHSELVSSF